MQDDNIGVFRPRISGRVRKEKTPALLSVAKHLGKSGGGLKYGGAGPVRKAKN
jgi:hypothetical protein